MFNNIYLIFNPVSGKGDPEVDLELIRSAIESQAKLTVLETTPDESAGQLVETAIAQNADCIIASGGDGTVSAVAGGLLESSTPLCIIPRGTANAIATAFGISSNIAVACETVLTGVPRKIDAATCNGKPLLLLAGIGLEAEVIARADRQLKDKIGSAAYILSALQQVQDLHSFQAKLETPEKIITVEAAGITVANTAPPTSVLAHGPSDVIPYDGLLDVTIFSPQGTSGAIAASYNLFQSAISKRSIRREDVGYFRCSAVTISTEPEQKVVLDGEIVGTSPIQVTCLPKSLTIMTPRDGAFDPPERLEGLPSLNIEKK